MDSARTPSKKTALITDLDNTLFDWADLWYKCFSAMLDEIVRISGVNRETLIPEMRAIHQRYGTSEYSFLIEELPSLQPLLKGKQATEMFAPAIEAYRDQRRRNLKLFPTVAETLLKIKGRETRIIGYTESMGFYSAVSPAGSTWSWGAEDIIQYAVQTEPADSQTDVSVTIRPLLLTPAQRVSSHLS